MLVWPQTIIIILQGYTFSILPPPRVWAGGQGNDKGKKGEKRERRGKYFFRKNIYPCHSNWEIVRKLCKIPSVVCKKLKLTFGGNKSSSHIQAFVPGICQFWLFSCGTCQPLGPCPPPQNSIKKKLLVYLQITDPIKLFYDAKVRKKKILWRRKK